MPEWQQMTLPEWQTMQLTSVDPLVAYSLTYTYDPAGNRLTLGNFGSITTYTYDAGNRLLTSQDAGGTTTFTYDADGNRLEQNAPD